MEYQFGFERLKVWKEARTLNVNVYNLTKTFPREETFGITNQLRRASLSIGLNIAEGSGRKTPKDQARMYNVAYGSLMEVLAGLIMAHDLNYLPSEEINSLKRSIAKIGNQLNALSKAINTND